MTSTCTGQCNDKQTKKEIMRMTRGVKRIEMMCLCFGLKLMRYSKGRFLPCPFERKMNNKKKQKHTFPLTTVSLISYLFSFEHAPQLPPPAMSATAVAGSTNTALTVGDTGPKHPQIKVIDPQRPLLRCFCTSRFQSPAGGFAFSSLSSSSWCWWWWWWWRPGAATT